LGNPKSRRRARIDQTAEENACHGKLEELPTKLSQSDVKARFVLVTIAAETSEF
jgi:hypothetical protein